MNDDPKVPPSSGSGDSPATKPDAAEVKPSPSPAQANAGGAKPAPPAAPPKPAGAATPPKPPAPPKPPTKPDPWSSPLLDELQKRFPGAIGDPLIFRGQPSTTLARESLLAICEFLKSDEGGSYTLLTDETAVDYPKRPKRFEVIYHLYSFQRNDRLRLKVLAGEGEKVPSVTGIWPAANWLEREVYDMFGVLFEGHPDLRRILLPEDWTGHPLRKDYDILRQDEAWIQANLHIESGQ